MPQPPAGPSPAACPVRQEPSQGLGQHWGNWWAREPPALSLLPPVLHPAKEAASEFMHKRSMEMVSPAEDRSAGRRCSRRSGAGRREGPPGTPRGGKKKKPPVNVKSSEKSPHESSCAVRPRNGNLEKSRQFLDAWLRASGLCFPRRALLKGKGRRSAKSLARHQHAERIKASMAESVFLGERRAHAESPYLHNTGLFNPD
ncbi:PREDICTED: uncharacterized protein LOC103926265 [Pygoscelis adeliae]|uniref:uncharacterized protein LOC103926265 n=1 Tax=Pygoscelis adeliae TaxID=9238 RepID=UPI0004F4DD6C|nr:PREDICTED: uncharacterized protein LOC103926265 [Pygoscelis adeliae]